MWNLEEYKEEWRQGRKENDEGKKREEVPPHLFL